MSVKSLSILLLFFLIPLVSSKDELLRRTVETSGDERLRKFSLQPGDKKLQYNNGNNDGDDGDSGGGCFAGSESVMIPGGRIVSISEVTIGDQVQVYKASNHEISFSKVIYIPHTKEDNENRKFGETNFIELRTVNSKSIVLTPSHLLPASSRCDDNKDAYVLQFASDVQIGSCILTIDGIERVASSNISKNHAGVYTLVTAADDEYIIVNGIVASMFSFSHTLLNVFYNIHRGLYRGFNIYFTSSHTWMRVLEQASKVFLKMVIS